MGNSDRAKLHNSTLLSSGISFLANPHNRYRPLSLSQQKPTSFGTGKNLLLGKCRLFSIRVVKRVADERSHPAMEHDGAAVALDQRVLAGGEHSKKLLRLGEADGERFADRAERRTSPFFQQIL